LEGTDPARVHPQPNAVLKVHFLPFLSFPSSLPSLPSTLFISIIYFTLINLLIKNKRDELGDKSFFVVSVTGFEDSPVSWGAKEHAVEKSGENNYSFVLLPNDEFWFFVALGACDEYR
jgi:hypothetical protein